MFNINSVVSDVKTKLAQKNINVKEQFKNCSDPKAKADELLKKYQESRGLSLPRDVYNETKLELVKEFSKNSSKVKEDKKITKEEAMQRIFCGLNTMDDYEDIFSEPKEEEEEEEDNILDVDDDLVKEEEDEEEEGSELEENSSNSDNMSDPEEKSITDIYRDYLSEPAKKEEEEEDSVEDTDEVSPNQVVSVDGAPGVVLSVDPEEGTAVVSFTSEYDEEDGDATPEKDIRKVSLDDISTVTSDDKENMEEDVDADDDDGDGDKLEEDSEEDILNVSDKPFSEPKEEEDNILDVDDDLVKEEEDEDESDISKVKTEIKKIKESLVKLKSQKKTIGKKAYESKCKKLYSKLKEAKKSFYKLKLEFTKPDINPKYAIDSRVIYAGNMGGTITSVDGDKLTVKLDKGGVVTDNFSQFELIDQTPAARTTAKIGEAVSFNGLKGKVLKIEGKAVFIKLEGGSILKTEMSKIKKESFKEEAAEGDEPNTGTKPYEDKDIEDSQEELDARRDAENAGPDARGPEVKTADNTEELLDELEDVLDSSDEEEANKKVEKLAKKYSKNISESFLKKVTKLTSILSKGRKVESKRLAGFISKLSENSDVTEPFMSKFSEIIADSKDKSMLEIVKMIQDIFSNSFGISIKPNEAEKILGKVLQQDLAAPEEVDSPKVEDVSDSEDESPKTPEEDNILDVDDDLVKEEAEEEDEEGSETDKKDMDDIDKVEEADSDEEDSEEDKKDDEMSVSESKGFVGAMFTMLSMIPEQTLKNAIEKTGRKSDIQIENWIKAGIISKKGKSFVKGSNLA